MSKHKTKILSVALPQGSVLGPVLFNIYVNDTFNVSDKFKYADDTNLLHSHKDVQTIEIVVYGELLK